MIVEEIVAMRINDFRVYVRDYLEYSRTTIKSRLPMKRYKPRPVRCYSADMVVEGSNIFCHSRTLKTLEKTLKNMTPN